jgi:hypothetical protein
MSYSTDDNNKVSDKRKALFELLMKERKNSRKDIKSQVIPKRQTNDSCLYHFSAKALVFGADGTGLSRNITFRLQSGYRVN